MDEHEVIVHNSKHLGCAFRMRKDQRMEEPSSLAQNGSPRIALSWCRQRNTAQPISFKFAFLAVLYAIMLTLVGSHPFHVDHTDAELEHMDMESLLHIERDLREQNSLIQEHIANLRFRQAQMLQKQKIMEKEFKKLQSGRDWEMRQTLRRQKELNAAMAHMQTRTEQVKTMTSHAESVRRDIREMEQKLKSLRLDNMEAQARYAHPTMLDVLDAKIEFWGPTPHRILNKTLQTLILPGLSSSSDQAMQFRRRMRSSPQYSSLLSTFAIYIFSVCFVVGAYRLYRKVRDILTLSRLLFMADLSISALWFIVLVLNILLVADPIAIARVKFDVMFVAAQLCIGLIFMIYISLRCISVVSTLQGIECFELIACICVLQHYVQNCWTPSLTDAPLTTTVTAYFVYGSLHVSLAARRARAQVFGKNSIWKDANEDNQPELFQHKKHAIEMEDSLLDQDTTCSSIGSRELSQVESRGLRLRRCMSSAAQKLQSFLVSVVPPFYPLQKRPRSAELC